MGKSIRKGRVSKPNLKIGNGGIHPKSRKAEQIGKQLLHEKRIEQRKREKQSKQNIASSKLLWFQQQIERDEFSNKRAFSMKEIKMLLQKYFESMKGDIIDVQLQRASLPSKRSVSSTLLKKEQKIAQTAESEIQQASAVGIDIPDLLCIENVKRLREWKGDPQQAKAIFTIKVKHKASGII